MIMHVHVKILWQEFLSSINVQIITETSSTIVRE